MQAGGGPLPGSEQSPQHQLRNSLVFSTPTYRMRRGTHTFGVHVAIQTTCKGRSGCVWWSWL